MTTKPIALKPVRPGEPFELPNGDLVRIESVLPDSIYLGYGDHGAEVTPEWLAIRGFKLGEDNDAQD